AKPLAGARLDESTGQQQVELPARIRRPQHRTQARRIPPRALARKRHVESCHDSLHLLEVPQLLSSEPRERHTQLPILRVREHQGQGGGGSLLLAICVVHQQVAPALDCKIYPRIGSRAEQYRVAADHASSPTRANHSTAPSSASATSAALA